MELESIIKTFSIPDLNNRVKANWRKNATIYYEFIAYSNGTRIYYKNIQYSGP